MKNHCKAIAIIGMILIVCLTGIRIYEWYISGFYNQQQGWIIAAAGIFTAYLVYVMWSAFAEILGRVEELRNWIYRSFSEIEGIEKKMDELNKQVCEKMSALDSTEQIKEWKYLDFGENKTDAAENSELKNGKSENILPEHPDEKTQAESEEQILRSEVRFCSYCGKPIQKSVKFCKYCGTKIEP